MTPLAPLFALLLAASPARAADRVEAVSAETPLSPAGPTINASADLAPATLALPASALPAGAGVSIPNVPAQRAAWAEATPQAFAAPPAANAAPIAARPYFAAALERADVDPRLVSRLADYLAAPGRHPGPQGDVYHGLHHSYDVAALAARLADNPQAGGLRKEQKALLVLAAALHDVDPRRDPGTPASVTRTLDYISDDPETRQLVDAFAERYGFTAAQLKALIMATDFSPDPAQAKLLAEKADAALGGNFRDAEWARTWARRLAFADKMASYVGDPAYADRQVRGLANEIKMDPLTVAKGSINFLKPLSQSPDYALLPADLRANFETVLTHFADVAAHPDKYAATFAPRGPPEPAEVLYARSAAAQPVSPALASQLADFQKKGFMLLSAEGAVDPPLVRGVRAATAKETERRTWELFEKPGPGLKKSRPDFDGWTDNVGNVRAIVARLTELLRRAAPGENIVPAKAGLRLEFDSKGAVPVPHIDARYATVTLALEGPGTDLWDDGGGQVRVLHAPTGVVAAITARDRAAALGAPGTVHATPGFFRGRRLVLVVNYEREGLAPNNGADADADARRRVDSVLRRAGQGPAAGGKKAGGEGLLGRLKNIFE